MTWHLSGDHQPTLLQLRRAPPTKSNQDDLHSIAWSLGNLELDLIR